jgi:hypothetical protein
MGLKVSDIESARDELVRFLAARPLDEAALWHVSDWLFQNTGNPQILRESKLDEALNKADARDFELLLAAEKVEDICERIPTALASREEIIYVESVFRKWAIRYQVHTT